MVYRTTQGLQGHHVLLLFGVAWLIPYSLISSEFLRSNVLSNIIMAASLSVNVSVLITAVLASQVLIGSAFVIGDRRLSWSDLGFRQVHWAWFFVAMGTLVVIKFSFGPLAGLIAVLSSSTSAADARAIPAERAIVMTGISILPLIMVGPVTAIVEEAFFRGVLYSWLRRNFGLFAAACLSALVFSLVHKTFMNSGGIAGWVLGAEIFASGVALALLYEKSGSLWPSIYMHAMNNVMGPLQRYIHDSVS